MASASFANESQKIENAAVNSNGSGLALIPWDLFIGGMNSFTVGADWIFGNFNILYASETFVGVDSQNPGSLGAYIWCLFAAHDTVYVFWWTFDNV